MLSPKPNLRPTTFGIRTRPPLNIVNSNVDPVLSDISCHFDLLNKKKLLLNNS